MSREGLLVCASHRIPQTNGIVLTSTCQYASIWTERDIVIQVI